MLSSNFLSFLGFVCRLRRAEEGVPLNSISQHDQLCTKEMKAGTVSELVRALREGDRSQAVRAATEKSDRHCALSPSRAHLGSDCPLCGVVLILLGPSQGHLDAPSFQGTRLVSLVTSCSSLSPPQDFSLISPPH